MAKVTLSHDEVDVLARTAANKISEHFKSNKNLNIYGVPRGGVPALYLINHWLSVDYSINVHVSPQFSGAVDVVVDDLIDSGRTMAKFQACPFFALLDKRETDTRFHKQWIVFPWEHRENGMVETNEDNVTRMLQLIGEDPEREGLRDTPKRVTKAYEEWFSGYREDPESLFKTFADGAPQQQGDEMLLVANIPIYSHCEHHLAPFFGFAHVAYIPNGRIIGLSKIARVVRCFSRRLQVQERLTNQIADVFETYLQPKGVGVLTEARHLCMESRGVCMPGTVTTHSALRGNILLNPSARNEFLTLVRGNGSRL